MDKCLGPTADFPVVSLVAFRTGGHIDEIYSLCVVDKAAYCVDQAVTTVAVVSVSVRAH